MQISDSEIEELLEVLFRIKDREQNGEIPIGTTTAMFKDAMIKCFKQLNKDI